MQLPTYEASGLNKNKSMIIDNIVVEKKSVPIVEKIPISEKLYDVDKNQYLPTTLSINKEKLSVMKTLSKQQSTTDVMPTMFDTAKNQSSMSRNIVQENNLSYMEMLSTVNNQPSIQEIGPKNSVNLSDIVEDSTVQNKNVPILHELSVEKKHPFKSEEIPRNSDKLFDVDIKEHTLSQKTISMISDELSRLKKQEPSMEKSSVVSNKLYDKVKKPLLEKDLAIDDLSDDQVYK